MVIFRAFSTWKGFLSWVLSQIFGVSQVGWCGTFAQQEWANVLICT